GIESYEAYIEPREMALRFQPFLERFVATGDLPLIIAKELRNPEADDLGCHFRLFAALTPLICEAHRRCWLQQAVARLEAIGYPFWRARAFIDLTRAMQHIVPTKDFIAGALDSAAEIEELWLRRPLLYELASLIPPAMTDRLIDLSREDDSLEGSV